ncbi:helix-turn-helix domain-containing protein [Sulfobacillus harzensis]|uniref:Helix-turn-helix domain-containing protein n=1 Tax=Sulfobacillus harzensis TaxID=2729629 RepID=A0A7Y0L5F4_9FIRM|nr:helix-turn-helix domain-containing protein [Sulfobacillus harzensis]NMP23560.1 helix-turn-helix domain-containing protein [Sulfobacillus harzensis]
MGKYLTVEEVAEQLQVSSRTVHRWIRDEGLPAIKLARAVRVDADDLAGWLAGRKTGGRSHA